LSKANDELERLVKKREKLKSDLEAMNDKINGLISSPKSDLFKKYKKKYSNTFWKAVSAEEDLGNEESRIQVIKYYHIKNVMALFLDYNGEILIKAKYNYLKIQPATGKIEFNIDRLDWGVYPGKGNKEITKAEYEKEKADFIKGEGRIGGAEMRIAVDVPDGDCCVGCDFLKYDRCLVFKGTLLPRKDEVAGTEYTSDYYKCKECLASCVKVFDHAAISSKSRSADDGKKSNHSDCTRCEHFEFLPGDAFTSSKHICEINGKEVWCIDPKPHNYAGFQTNGMVAWCDKYKEYHPTLEQCLQWLFGPQFSQPASAEAPPPSRPPAQDPPGC